GRYRLHALAASFQDYVWQWRQRRDGRRIAGELLIRAADLGVQYLPPRGPLSNFRMPSSTRGGSMDCGHSDQDLFFHGCDTSAEDGSDGIHALIVGTSLYPRATPRRRRTAGQAERAPRKRRFKDIEGAARGAADFAVFLRNRFRDPRNAPLRTVRLL